MRIRRHIFDKIDWWTILLYIIFIVIGWLNVYAALYNENYNLIDFSQKYGRQLIWISISFLIAIFILFFDWKFFDGFAYLIYILSLLILIGVLFWGIEVNGAKSWLDFGFVRIQPAEFAKVGCCLAIAKFLSGLNMSLKKMKYKVIAALLILSPIILIILQNDTGSAIVYSTFIIVLYRFGLPSNLLIVTIVTSILFITSIIVSKIILIIILSIIACCYITN